MVKDLIVTRSILLQATPERVWEALTHPGMTRHYMYNCEVCADWTPGCTISWKGTYEDNDIFLTGQILDIIPGRLLKFTMSDPYSSDIETGAYDPGNYVHVTYELLPKHGMTQLVVSLDNFNEEEARAEEAADLWDLEILPKLKSLVETTL